MSRHRLERARPRYGRMAAAGLACAVTLFALAAGAGAVPGSLTDAEAVPQAQVDPRAIASFADTVAGAERAEESVEPAVAPAPAARPAPVLKPEPTTLPADSGEGRRVVFSEGRQRVWLVDSDGEVERTYLVSGSVYDNLDPGTYAVYSRSESAYGIDDSGTMRYFVRFTRGERAAIGFHDIPIHQGELVQTEQQLGTPLSHGCIRQKREDAIALWEFAPIGTKVVVTP